MVGVGLDSTFTYLLAAAVFWLTILFLDMIFQSCMLPPYLNLLNEGRLKVKPGYLQFYTTHWNRKLQKLGCWRPKLQKNWYSLGTLVSCVLMPVAVILLISMLRSIISKQDRQEQLIQPVLPGVNLPMSEVLYYLATLLFCSVIHELGHALASTREDVKVDGIGVFFLGIFPGAFVSLPTEQIVQLLPWQQLQIFCAGIWHNTVLAFVSYLLLVINPYIVLPLYESGNGVTATNVVQGTGISSPTGLQLNDQVTAINNCPVKNALDWMECIEAASMEPQSGYCVSRDFLKNHDKNIQFKPERACCGNLTASHLCFEMDQRYSCLPVRMMLLLSPFSCSSSLDCDDCAIPVLENRYRLLQIARRKKEVVLFVGDPLELKLYVSVSNYVPRLSVFPVSVVHMWETLLKYIIAFSGALAVLNVVPCRSLDGQWITEALVDLTLKKFMQKAARQTLSYILTVGGTALLLTNVLIGIYSLYR